MIENEKLRAFAFHLEKRLTEEDVFLLFLRKHKVTIFILPLQLKIGTEVMT